MIAYTTEKVNIFFTSKFLFPLELEHKTSHKPSTTFLLLEPGLKVNWEVKTSK